MDIIFSDIDEHTIISGFIKFITTLEGLVFAEVHKT